MSLLSARFSELSISIIVAIRRILPNATNNITNAQTLLDLLPDFSHVLNLDAELKVLYNCIF